jgi:AcrR family transcriptional regulator
VHGAVRELLTEGPADALTIPVIATRAGVHATTVYRRWGSVGELLADVTASRPEGDVVVPDTGSLRGDLEHWAASVAADLADPDVTALMRASIGTNLPEGCNACVVDRHSQLDAMLARERERGGTPPTTERAAELLLGPLYYRAIFTADPGDAAWARGLVGVLLD